MLLTGGDYNMGNAKRIVLEKAIKNPLIFTNRHVSGIGDEQRVGKCSRIARKTQILEADTEKAEKGKIRIVKIIIWKPNRHGDFALIGQIRL
jgi:hypothetical protein